jgi:hypothetical protein
VEGHQKQNIELQEIPKVQQKPERIGLDELLKKQREYMLAYRGHGCLIKKIALYAGLL